MAGSSTSSFVSSSSTPPDPNSLAATNTLTGVGTNTTPSPTSTGSNSPIVSQISSSVSPTSTGSNSPIVSQISSSVSPTSTAPDSQGLSSGAVAGVGIGTFLAGVVLALIGAWLCVMQRRKKNRSRRSHGRRPFEGSVRDSDAPPDSGTPMKQMRVVESGIDMRLDKILLEPISSGDLKKEMLTIGSQIIQHVDNNYHLEPVDNLPASFADVLTRSRYSMFTGLSIDQLSLLLRNGLTRRAALRHLIGYFIFSRIALTSDLETSLLPSHIIAFLRQMPSPERTAGSREAFDQVLTKWRLLSAYLLQTVRSNRDPLLPNESSIQPAIESNVIALRQILAPFIIPGAERRQADNLHGLLLEGAKFGLLLFQQPASWVVDWEIPPIKSSNKDEGANRPKPAVIVLFPGLVKTANEKGERYPEARSELTPEVLYV